MPRGRPDPLGQVADGGRVHLVPDLEILEQEAKVNLLDTEVLRIFVEARIYDRTTGQSRSPR